jgi:ferrochelatase
VTDLDRPPLDPPAVDALLLVSFGGPEGPADVVPFLETVTRGRGIPAERLAEVGRHYLDVFGGVSPINEQCRELVAALEKVVDLPVYWGNRNWHPLLTDTLQQMRDDGIRHAYALVTSAFPSYSGCRQYREDIARAQVDGAPVVTKLRHYYAEEGFVRPMARNVRRQLEGLGPGTRLVFTAHSIPLVMADTSGPTGGAYVEALRAAAELVVERLGVPYTWDLVFQSRSGPPQVPWLAPDVGDHLEELYAEGVREAVMVPIGFTSDHVEVVYDLDVQAQERVAALSGMTVRRAATVGTDPEFVAMLAGLVAERSSGPELPTHGCVATHDRCPAGCCPPPPPRR